MSNELKEQFESEVGTYLNISLNDAEKILHARNDLSLGQKSAIMKGVQIKANIKSFEEVLQYGSKICEELLQHGEIQKVKEFSDLERETKSLFDQLNEEYTLAFEVFQAYKM